MLRHPTHRLPASSIVKTLTTHMHMQNQGIETFEVHDVRKSKERAVRPLNHPSYL